MTPISRQEDLCANPLSLDGDHCATPSPLMGEGWGEGEIPLILTFSHQGRRDSSLLAPGFAALSLMGEGWGEGDSPSS